MAIEIRILCAGYESVSNNVASGVFDHQVDKDLTAEFLRDRRHHFFLAIEDNMVGGFASALHYVRPDRAARPWIDEIGVASHGLRQGDPDCAALAGARPTLH